MPLSHRDQQLVELLYANKPRILDRISLGSGIAEQDDLLNACRIETRQFHQLLRDEVDLIPGTKGSGKSAMYRLLENRAQDVYKEVRVVLIGGVDIKGEPVFKHYVSEFTAFDEDDFEAFWKLYFIYLVSAKWINTREYRSDLLHARDQVEVFHTLCHKLRFPPLKGHFSLFTILQNTIDFVRQGVAQKNIQIKHTWADPSMGSTEVQISNQDKSPGPTNSASISHPGRINLTPIFEAINDILDASQTTIWIMMDQLDTVFPRRSDEERRALRSLLRVGYSLGRPNLKVKVFLRDDILEFLSDTADGFVGLSHIADRQAPTLEWDVDHIRNLIAKRLLHHPILGSVFDVRDLKNLDPEMARTCVRVTFPDKINKQEPLRWLFNYLSDGRGRITPRDVINLLKNGLAEESKRWANGHHSSRLFSPESLLSAWETISKNKTEDSLYPEYPNFKNDIETFVGGKHRYTREEIRSLLGADWQARLKNLTAIGLLAIKRDDHSRDHPDIFVVPRLYRPSLRIIEERRRHPHSPGNDIANH